MDGKEDLELIFININTLTCEKNKMLETDYFAISYVWSHKHIEEWMIKTPNYVSYVTAFPKENLKKLCDYYKDKINYIWIDCISINQKDEKEKNKLIPSIPSIFKNSKRIVAVPDLKYKNIQDYLYQEYKNLNINENSENIAFCRGTIFETWCERSWVVAEIFCMKENKFEIICLDEKRNIGNDILVTIDNINQTNKVTINDIIIKSRINKYQKILDQEIYSDIKIINATELIEWFWRTKATKILDKLLCLLPHSLLINKPIINFNYLHSKRDIEVENNKQLKTILFKYTETTIYALELLMTQTETNNTPTFISEEDLICMMPYNNKTAYISNFNINNNLFLSTEQINSRKRILNEKSQIIDWGDYIKIHSLFKMIVFYPRKDLILDFFKINCLIIKIKSRYYEKIKNNNKLNKKTIEIIEKYNMYQEIFKNKDVEKILNVIQKTKENKYEIIYLPIADIAITKKSNIVSEKFILNMVCLRKKEDNKLVKIKMKITYMDEIKYSNEEKKFEIY